jgi:hypothetical protein
MAGLSSPQAIATEVRIVGRMRAPPGAVAYPSAEESLLGTGPLPCPTRTAPEIADSIREVMPMERSFCLTGVIAK